MELEVTIAQYQTEIKQWEEKADYYFEEAEKPVTTVDEYGNITVQPKATERHRATMLQQYEACVEQVDHYRGLAEVAQAELDAIREQLERQN